MVGCPGADYFDGGIGIDTVSYYYASSGVTVYLDNRSGNTREAAGDYFVNVENILGSQFADTLCGDSKSNVLTGGGGNDELWGYGGNDTFYGGNGDNFMVGGPGADYFDGGTGIDTVSYYYASSGVTVYLDNRSGNTREAAGDYFVNVENILGSQFADTLCGDSKSNVLTGGGGNDCFVFNTAANASTNKDTITDFASGADHIQFSKAIFTGLMTVVGDLTTDQFWSGDGVVVAHDASDRIIYNTTSGALYYDADGNGTAASAVQVVLIGISSHGAVAYTDIQIIA